VRSLRSGHDPSRTCARHDPRRHSLGRLGIADGAKRRGPNDLFSRSGPGAVPAGPPVASPAVNAPGSGADAVTACAVRLPDMPSIRRLPVMRNPVGTGVDAWAAPTRPGPTGADFSAA
jgi:hypothetical protein